MDASKTLSAEICRAILEVKWGIVCEPSCLCYDAGMQRILERSRELDSKILQFASISPDRSLGAVKQLLENHGRMGSSFIGKERTLYDGFQIAIVRSKTMSLAHKYIREAYEINSSIMHPKSEKTLKLERWVKSKDYSSHHNYLRLK
jgi:hypothetical protein